MKGAAAAAALKVHLQPERGIKGVKESGRKREREYGVREAKRMGVCFEVQMCAKGKKEEDRRASE